MMHHGLSCTPSVCPTVRPCVTRYSARTSALSRGRSTVHPRSPALPSFRVRPTIPPSVMPGFFGSKKLVRVSVRPSDHPSDNPLLRPSASSTRPHLHPSIFGSILNHSGKKWMGVPWSSGLRPLVRLIIRPPTNPTFRPRRLWPARPSQKFQNPYVRMTVSHPPIRPTARLTVRSSVHTPALTSVRAIARPTVHARVLPTDLQIRPDLN